MKKLNSKLLIGVLLLVSSSQVFSARDFAAHDVGNGGRPWENFSAESEGGQDVGNGGHGCLINNSIKFVDTLVSRSEFNLSFDHNLEQFNVQLLVLELINRLQKRLPILHDKFLNSYRYFEKNKSFLDDLTLTPTNDEDLLFIPKDCGLKQIAKQVEMPPSGEVIFFFNQTLYNSLSIEDRAALVFHELIYHVMGYKTGRKVRYFNALLFSNKLNELKNYEFLKAMTYLGVESAFFSGVNIELKKYLTFYGDGSIRSGRIIKNSIVRIGGYELNVQKGATFSLYENSVIKSIQYSKSNGRRVLIKFGTKSMFLSGMGVITFYKEGSVRAFDLGIDYHVDDDEWLAVVSAGARVTLNRDNSKIIAVTGYKAILENKVTEIRYIGLNLRDSHMNTFLALLND